MSLQKRLEEGTLSISDLKKLYGQGFSGAICDRKELDEFAEALPEPVFEDLAHTYGLAESGKGKLALPFKSVIHFDPNAYEERQTTGDCVSHSTRNACDVSRAVEIHIKNEPEGWWARTATEPIYGYRGHSGAGASCARLAKWVTAVGGMMLRKKYPELGLDLSVYNASIGIRWGGRGVPEEVRKEAAKHPLRSMSRVSTIEAARDAIANGYAISVCSSFGFSSKRDEKGIARRSGSWAHAMAWIAVDDTHERLPETLFLVQNSWGKWNSGPKVHGQPDGSFWIRESAARGMLNQGGAFVLNDAKGFPPRELPDYGFDYL